MRWWEEHGKDDFPRIYVIACCILMMPDSNGHQERTFSSATWMDGKLNKRQSPATFEMKNLLYRNMDFMSKAKLIITRELLQELKEMASRAVSDLLKETEAARAKDEANTEDRRIKAMMLKDPNEKVEAEEALEVDNSDDDDDDEDFELRASMKRTNI